MSESVRSRLESVPLDPAAEARAWELVRTAHAERTPARRRVPPRAALLAAATMLAATVAAAFLSPPGRAVVDAVRRTLGVEGAAPALLRLPAPGRLLVSGPGGAWVVSANGARRLLGSYRHAAWSPHGLYVLAAGGGTLAALGPDGRLHWTLARPGASLAAWGGTRTNTRVAFLSGGRLHVVAGDGTGERAYGRATPVRPAWRPSDPGAFVLAWVTAAGRVVVGVPGSRPLWRSAVLGGRPRLLAWSADGVRLAVATTDRLFLFDVDRAGSPIDVSLPRVRALAFARDGRLAAVRGRSVLLVARGGATTTLFSAPSRLAGLAWAPDGRWLLTALPRADQWVFVGPHRVAAVSNVGRRFGGPVELDGWMPAAYPG